MIAIIDYNMGNLGSIENMCKRIGVPALISSKIEEIEKASKLILPGVGAFDEGMKNLKSLGLIEILRKKIVEDKIPVLGICLGMQLFTRSSEEGVEKGMGFFEADTLKFKGPKELKIPHMGWNTLEIQKENPLLNLNENYRFYFVHSYHVVCSDSSDILSTTQYGVEFVSAIQKNNIYGVQFHPEKSHKFGMSLIKKFSEQC